MCKSKYRCSCGAFHRQSEWRKAWRHALEDGRVVSVRDNSGSQIELRSYPTREMLWNFVATLTDGMSAHVVEAR